MARPSAALASGATKVNKSRKLWSRQVRNVAPPEIRNYTSAASCVLKKPVPILGISAAF